MVLFENTAKENSSPVRSRRPNPRFQPTLLRGAAEAPAVERLSLLTQDTMKNTASEESAIPKPPEKVTSPAADYFQTSFRNLGLFHLVIDTVLSGDFVAHIAQRALDGQELDKEIDRATLARKEPGPCTRQLRKYRQELLEAFFARFVDNFEVYLVDILREVLRQKPEILRSRQQTVTLEYVLQFPSIDNLVQDIIEGKVNSLSYKGFSELEQWYAEKGIPLVVNTEDRQVIVELIATRNIIVHNRGRIDERYLRTVPASTYKSGELRELEVDDLFKALSILNTIVSATDQEIAKKFILETSILKKREPELD